MYLPFYRVQQQQKKKKKMGWVGEGTACVCGGGKWMSKKEKKREKKKAMENLFLLFFLVRVVLTVLKAFLSLDFFIERVVACFFLGIIHRVFQ